MKENKLDIDYEFIRDKILFELSQYDKKEQKRIKESTGIDDQYIRNMLCKGESRHPISLPALILFAKALNKPVDYFLYEKPIFQNIVKEEFINVPYIETYTDSENNLIYKSRNHMCAMRYDSLLKLSEEPMKIVIYTMNSDTMEMTFYKGDELLIDTSKKIIKDGGIYAFNSFDIKHIRIRRFLFQVNDLKLIADNKKYETCISSLKDIKIIGQVIASKHFFI